MLTLNTKDVTRARAIYFLIRGLLSKGKDIQSKISHLAMPTLGMLTMEFKSTDLHELQLGTINSKTKDITLSEILSSLKRVMHILIKDHFCLKNKKTGSLLLKRNSTN
ncbi:uncharacterized protein isoform X2 [Leptinotarsa decemlineata]|uniref:uncharacterized protein isoform X2 n=1 Tax=Leptinotarsa decemlineata TaxID=7539 RepID=UPI003D306DBA